ncbi:MAG: sel1 repeat family protein [Candidatus Riflebacteria bacterium]|nr:sel1 repeat family protein [Candidatus Riflebacteria bacterium]
MHRLLLVTEKGLPGINSIPIRFILLLFAFLIIFQVHAAAETESLINVSKLIENAEKGNPIAQFSLGWMYFSGKGVEKDLDEAEKWLTKSSDQGYKLATIALRDLNLELGKLRNPHEAEKYFRMAAENGNAEAQLEIGKLTLPDRGLVKAEYSDLRKAEDPKESLKWLKMSAMRGNPEALFLLAVMYENGDGVEKNLAEAEKYYKKAADSGHNEALRKLSDLMLDDVDSTQKNFEESVKLLRKAAEGGNVKAQFMLGEMYYYGEKLDQDLPFAAIWFRKAANQNHSLAQFHLGMMYANGKGVEKNLVQAYKWYLKSASDNDKATLEIIRILETRMTLTQLAEAKKLSMQ